MIVIQGSAQSELTEDSTLKSIQGAMVKYGTPGDINFNSPTSSSAPTSL